MTNSHYASGQGGKHRFAKGIDKLGLGGVDVVQNEFIKAEVKVGF